MNNEQMRASFEKHALQKGYQLGRDRLTGWYDSRDTSTGWAYWQSAHAATAFQESKIMGEQPEKKTVTVCDKCLQATCWQGIFMCDESRDAGIVEKTRDELVELNLEHPCYWVEPSHGD